MRLAVQNIGIIRNNVCTWRICCYVISPWGNEQAAVYYM